MNKCIITGFVAALATITGAFAVSTATSRPNSPVTVHSQRFDGCPYYPSPIVCNVDSTVFRSSGS